MSSPTALLFLIIINVARDADVIHTPITGSILQENYTNMSRYCLVSGQMVTPMLVIKLAGNKRQYFQKRR